jgi:hypothetical protein
MPVITKTALVHAAVHHGIFAEPTISGQSGSVLLASLDINVNSELLELIARGEVTALAQVSADRGAVEHRLQVELVGRGIPEAVARRLIQLSWHVDTSHFPDRWYYALLLPASAATTDTLWDYHIYCMLEWLADRTDPAAADLREACRLALGEISAVMKREQQHARELCVQGWNRYAGISP